ncbi:hypothetical protein HYQ43_04635 [Paracoccus pantotrophus]|uniref:Chromosomal replication initiator DnaA C-terminal domain-containing protein n=1 Tax=Paracoccus pantotrophus TaxID=82367 RepID=A0A7H9BUJ3_PARPN|nr:helix-turn-helix domain-containing protein [Paracoccus pantotrophus]QLH13571.1 hypothetical protein HYQ43_04635 [Paracoccus pantotrophus]
MTPAQIEEARAIAAQPGRAAVMRAIRDVSAQSGVPVGAIMGHDRRPRIVAARHLAMRVAHDAGVPLAEIGRVMGRDHTSVMHAVRKSPIRTEVRG